MFSRRQLVRAVDRYCIIALGLALIAVLAWGFSHVPLN